MVAVHLTEMEVIQNLSSLLRRVDAGEEFVVECADGSSVPFDPSSSRPQSPQGIAFGTWALHFVQSDLKETRQRQRALAASDPLASRVSLLLDEDAVEKMSQEEYDQLSQVAIQQAIDDPRPGVDGRIVNAYFARRRKEAQSDVLRKAWMQVIW